MSSDRSVLCQELRSTQEEVDTRLLLHTCHAGRNGYTTVVISSDDTDVFVLSLALKRQCGSAEHRPEQGISTSHMLFSATVQSCADVFLGYTLLLVVQSPFSG